MLIQSVFQDRVSEFPADAAAILGEMPKQQGMLEAAQVNQLKDILNLPIQDLMVQLLPVAAAISVAPVSKFYVGVVAEGLSGALYFGANLEFLDQPLKVTLHAEQCAVTNAWHKGEEGLVRLAVNEAPCGHCRQFLNELSTAKTLEIIVRHASEGVVRHYSINDLLPYSFGPEDLGLNAALMADLEYPLALPENEERNAMVDAALTAASKSYAPVCESRAGMALKLSSGQIITGRYAANAAFNPGVTAMEAAVVNWRLALLANPEEKIVEATMVEQPLKSSQKDLAISFLKKYGVSLHYIKV